MKKQRKVTMLQCILLAGAGLLTVLLAVMLFGSVGNPASSAQEVTATVGIMDKFDMFMTNTISDSLSGVLEMEKVYWLNDDEMVAPEPDPSCYGETDDPATLQWLLDEAAPLIGDEELYFSLDTVLAPDSKVRYYLDDTIFAITWKEGHDYSTYCFSEIRIAHASQFRRFLAGGEYGSEKQFITTEMAASVNAVVASSGDFYRFRNFGTIVYDGVVQRIRSENIDTCFIDDKGDLIFTYAGELTDIHEAQKFVDENNIRFSVAFGPILVDNGENVVPNNYYLGEIKENYPRSALCQMGERHYLLATANGEGQKYSGTPTIFGFAKIIHATGCDKAYTLDGGQTAVIAMNDELVNAVLFGFQRRISDIIYFATAVPDGG